MITKIKLSKFLVVILGVLLFLFAISCGTENGTNHNPTISLSADKSTIAADGKVIFTATVTDADNDMLTVTWSDNGGSLNQTTGLTVTWTAPSFGGTYNISATVTDGHGGSATDSKSIQVSVNADITPPTNTTDNNFINNGATTTSSSVVTLSISATDNIGVTGYYISENSNTPSSSAYGWTSVSATTNYSANVSFTLSNGDGTKIIYVWFKDASGNISTSTNGSIKLITVINDITYNATTDFSINNGNPNGVWSYGWISLDFSTFNLYLNSSPTGTNEPFPRPHWYRDKDLNGYVYPCIWRNDDIVSHYNTDPDQIALHPSDTYEASVLRWTTPSEGLYHIEGQFFAGDPGTMKIGIRHGSIWLWQGVDSGIFNLDIPLTVGESIDFLVYGGFYYGTTPLKLTISLKK